VEPAAKQGDLVLQELDVRLELVDLLLVPLDCLARVLGVLRRFSLPSR
jgi:hypothetical protein